ncbi:hypothetical protein AOQ84DRAFT_224387 [Glonium stellatum]|uniref:Rhamnogalacturonase A/B/Epimerase-like pectate lyase domain-containing protein n=1 Tax=Glonium stellatum TaxID=574774 RepID=A0A8E2FAT2_9PEZI|nr:hypothetical protein AOQ84DRAFT_224387 [Glonium stellatum]
MLHLKSSFLQFLLLAFNILTFVAFPFTSAETVDYKNIKNAKGDKLPNFSFCGYHASEVALPAIDRKAAKTLKPGTGDQSAAIQAAINEVYKAGGGVVALEAGTYKISPGLLILNSTTLRGAGTGSTILTVDSLSDDIFTMGNQTSKGKAIKTALITDDYVPVGTGTVHVDDASGFAVGQTVFVQRAVTAKWVAAQGMNDLNRNDAPQTWIKPGTLVQQPRRIKSMNGKAISVDVPLTDSIDSTYMTGQLVAYTPPSQPSEMGLENLSIKLSPTCSGVILTSTNCTSAAISVSEWTTDSWVRNLDLTGFNNFVSVGYNASRITLTDIRMTRDGATDGGAGYALDIAVTGTQVLVANCATLGAADTRSYAVATKTLTPGPNAVLGYYVEQAVESIEPHERWAHGFLVENSTTASVLLRNRGTAGSGHGWSVNQGVAWNVNAHTLTIESPPLGENFCIGCVGQVETGSNGTFISSGALVDPPSLYAAQLADRGFDASKLGL